MKMPQLSGAQLDLDAEVTSRELIAALLEQASGTIPRLRDRDEEALHDFRVTVRRTRSCLRAYRPALKASHPKRIERRLRHITSSTNAGRDSEVLVDWLQTQRSSIGSDAEEGYCWLLDRLRERKEAAYSGAVDGIVASFPQEAQRINEELKPELFRARDSGPSGALSFAQRTGEAIERYVRKLQDRLAAIHTMDDERPAHRARISAKRVRYLLEPLDYELELRRFIEELKSLQDTLGDLHDRQVLMGEIDGVGTSESLLLSPDSSADLQPLAEGLETVRHLADREARELFARLESDWLGGAAVEFFSAMEGLARRLQARGSLGKEIERKYLLTGLPPEVEASPSERIEQGWLPGRRLQERLRKIETNGESRFYRCLKLGRGVQRTEVEEQTSQDLFEQLWPLTEGCRISKTRYRIAEGDLTWEIDEFDRLDLVLAEVELSTSDGAPVVPAWLEPYVDREVTGEDRYVNRNLAETIDVS